MPGMILINSPASRPDSVNSSTMVWFSVVETAPESTGAAAAPSEITSTSVLVVPTLSTMLGTVRESPCVMTIPSSCQAANPAALILRVYLPGGTATMAKKPSPLVLATRVSPLAAFLSSTAAPGTVAPVESVAVPLNEPVSCWPKRLLLKSKINVARNTLTRKTRITPDFRPDATDVVECLYMLSPDY